MPAQPKPFSVVVAAIVVAQAASTARDLWSRM
jgi:hypothetical protein